MDLHSKIEEAKNRFLEDLRAASSKDLLAQIKNRFLTGKESVLRGLFQLLSKIPPDKKGEEGKALNAFKSWVEIEIERVQVELGA
jgi:phenylalanyl-tRNA synthetase alpha subunit